MPDDAQDMNCPTCDDWIGVTPTAYGERAVCRRCKTRWTRLYGGRAGYRTWSDWTAEKFHTMNEHDYG